MRAVSARLADAAERVASTKREGGQQRRMDTDNELLSEMGEALEAVKAARRRVAASSSSSSSSKGGGLAGLGSAAEVGEFTAGEGGGAGGGDAWGVEGGDKGDVGAAEGGIFASVPPFVKGIVLMNIASILFGSNQVVIKQVVESGLDDFSQLFLRFGFAIIPLLPFVVQGLKSKQRPEMVSAALEMGTLLSVGYAAQIIGLDGTTSARQGSVPFVHSFIRSFVHCGWW